MAKKRKFRARQLAGQYTPSSTGTAGWLGYGSSVLDGKPYFITAFDVPRMMPDPLIQFGLRVLSGPLQRAKWEVQCKQPEVAKFIDDTYKRFWRDLLTPMIKQYFLWGYAGIIMDYAEIEGQWHIASGQIVWPSDAVPHVYKSGDRVGQFAGFELNNLNYEAQDHDEKLIPCPYSFWFAGLEERGGRLYDHSRLKWAFDPWLEKETRGGIRDNRKKFIRKWGVPPTVLYYPPGFNDPTDPNSIRNKDIAYEVSERIEAGSIIILPDTRTPDDKSEPKWRVQVLDTPKAAISFEEVMDYNDKMILLGMGIPRELFEASETGSGYSGRAIPQDTFLGMSDQLLNLLVRQIDHCIVRHLVEANFGYGIKYDVTVKPLSETLNQQGGMQGVMQDAASGGGSEDQTQQGSGNGGASIDAQGGGGSAEMGGGEGGGGDPTAGGLVPYLGKRGGHGKKDPKSGRVYYFSHDGTATGCLLAPCPGPLASQMLEFASRIPQEELATEGTENSPHLTLRYGLHTEDGNAVMNAVSQLGTLRILPGPIQMFEAPDHDVIYVSILNPELPTKWYGSVGALPNTSTHPTYNPHLTLAYLKKGQGKKYVGKEVCHGHYDFPVVEYHSPLGVMTSANVWPTADELMSMVSEPVDMAWVAGKSSRGHTMATWDSDPTQRRYGHEAERVLRSQQQAPQQQNAPAKPAPKQPDQGIDVGGLFKDVRAGKTDGDNSLYLRAAKHILDSGGKIDSAKDLAGLVAKVAPFQKAVAANGGQWTSDQITQLNSVLDSYLTQQKENGNGGQKEDGQKVQADNSHLIDEGSLRGENGSQTTQGNGQAHNVVGQQPKEEVTPSPTDETVEMPTKPEPTRMRRKLPTPVGKVQVPPLVEQLKRNPPKQVPVATPIQPAKSIPTATNIPVAAQIPVAKRKELPKPLPKSDHGKHLAWASDKIDSMADTISKLVQKHTGKPVSQQQFGLFRLKAQQAMKEALESGKPEVRLPVKLGDKTVYVVVRRKQTANLSNSTDIGWEVLVVDHA